jgi:hypothetical protein
MEKPVVGSDRLNLFQHYPLQFHRRKAGQKERRGQEAARGRFLTDPLPASAVPNAGLSGRG